MATARARRVDGWGSGDSSARAPARGGLDPAMQAALAQAASLLGRTVPITSGYRSKAEQASLYAQRSSNPYPVARPGSSAHERGRAVDVPRQFVPLLLAVSGRVGLCHPYPVADPVHFELCR
ncbi:MAG: D-alanyl-D-alanine carboxypeptidase [Acidimicrobiaceae bacterium]|nr:D-alanyl-D-alanine carboxypeptidase [Acidimicrobiaceae bacterium]